MGVSFKAWFVQHCYLIAIVVNLIFKNLFAYFTPFHHCNISNKTAASQVTAFNDGIEGHTDTPVTQMRKIIHEILRFRILDKFSKLRTKNADNYKRILLLYLVLDHKIALIVN